MRLLVVEDDPDLNRQLVTALTDAGYAVDSAERWRGGPFLGETEPYDAVILDLGLPMMDGVSVLERGGARTARCRCSSSPRATAGATRWRASMPARTITWPSRSTWRRCWPGFVRCFGAAPATPRARSDADRCGSTPRRRASAVNGEPVKLTSLEFRLLAYLMHHKGRVVSRTELVEHLYDQDFDRDSNTIEVFIGRLAQEARCRRAAHYQRARLLYHRAG